MPAWWHERANSPTLLPPCPVPPLSSLQRRPQCHLSLVSPLPRRPAGPPPPPAGTVQAVRPSAEMLADCEPSQALEALLSEPGATAAYDKLPVQVRACECALCSLQHKP